MKIEIKQGCPHIPYDMSPREQQMFDYCAIIGQVWSGHVDGEMVACWGVIPPSFLSEEAYIWMWNMPLKHPLIVARHSREVISTLLDLWPVLKGHCEAANPQSQRWLSWLGADFVANQGDLVRFEIRRAA